MTAPLPHSDPAERNKQPSLERLRQVLPAQGRALEIASGTGQHVVWFAAGLPQWTWQPTEPRKRNVTTALRASAALTTSAARRLMDHMASISKDHTFTCRPSCG